MPPRTAVFPLAAATGADVTECVTRYTYAVYRVIAVCMPVATRCSSPSPHARCDGDGGCAVCCLRRGPTHPDPTPPTPFPPRYHHHHHHPRAPPSPRPHRTSRLRIGTCAWRMAWRRCPRATRITRWALTPRARRAWRLWRRAAISAAPRHRRCGVLARTCLLRPQPQHPLRGRRTCLPRSKPQHLLRGRGRRRPALVELWNV